jgi:hypothetical protein
MCVILFRLAKVGLTIVHGEGLYTSVRIGGLFLFSDPPIRLVADTGRADLDSDLRLAGSPGTYPSRPRRVRPRRGGPERSEGAERDGPCRSRFVEVLSSPDEGLRAKGEGLSDSTKKE